MTFGTDESIRPLKQCLRLRRLAVFTLCIGALLVGRAEAEAGANSTLESVLRYATKVPWSDVGHSAFNRFRRSIVLGPYAGATGVVGSNDGNGGSLSFGVSFSHFDIPIVPDLSEFEEIVKGRFVAAIKEKLRSLAGKPSKLELAQLAKETWREVLSAFVDGPPRTIFEEPGVRIHAETSYQLATKDWQVRGTVGMGIGGLSVAVALGAQAGERDYLFVGAELSKPLIFGKIRTPVLDILVRVDHGLGDGSDFRSVALGARITLDIL
ncbi:MAG: hypothetical protein JKY56_17805 [Kofleriaceae bacterium]|nr:hypothetical protein [Kofleriaceae bacterium]